MRQQAHEEYSGFRSSGIRVSEDQLPTVICYSSEAEHLSLYAYHMFDKAHLVMLAEEDLIPRDDVSAMLARVRDMEAEGIEEVRLEVGGGMHLGEQYLIRKLGENVGVRIHLRRSSGDLGRIALRTGQRDRLLDLMTELNTFRSTALHVAEENLDAVMPG